MHGAAAGPQGAAAAIQPSLHRRLHVLKALKTYGARRGKVVAQPHHPSL